MKKRMPKQNKYLDEFNFLYDLINEFTKRLDIDSKWFYFLVQREINGATRLQGFVYHKNGLSKNTKVGTQFKRKKEIHEIAPYLASFSRLLSFIYERASKSVGEQAANVLEESYNHLKGKYSRRPNLEGYVPRGATAAAAAAAAAFDVSLMDNMLNYMINDVIKKGFTPTQRKIEAGKTGASKAQLTPEEMRAKIRTIYLAWLGPLGGKQYEKIGQTVDSSVILEQIKGFEKRGIINKEKANLMKGSIKGILVVGRDSKKEVQKIYAQTFGPIGEDLFGEIEGDLSYAVARKHIEKLAKEHIIKVEEKNKLLEAIKLALPQQ